MLLEPGSVWEELEAQKREVCCVVVVVVVGPPDNWPTSWRQVALA